MYYNEYIQKWYKIINKCITMMDRSCVQIMILRVQNENKNIRN